MFIIPTDIIFELFKYLDNNDTTNFLKYIKNTNKNIYIEIIISLNNQINHKDNTLKTIEYIYNNISNINTMKEYIFYKKKLNNLYIYSSDYRHNKLYNIIVKFYNKKYNKKIYNKKKNKFNNLCNVFLNNYFEEFPIIDYKQKIFSNNYIELSLENYLEIKDYLLNLS